MNEINSEAQSIINALSWAIYPLILVSTHNIYYGIKNLYRFIWLLANRKHKVSDPELAKALEGIKPPPYLLYAAIYISTGLISFFLAIKLYNQSIN